MKKIYAIYDNVAQETLNIFMANNDSSALRSFNQSIPQNVNKDDFRLFCIADIDLNIPMVRAFDSYLVKEEETDMSVPDNPAPVVSAVQHNHSSRLYRPSTTYCRRLPKACIPLDDNDRPHGRMSGAHCFCPHQTYPMR